MLSLEALLPTAPPHLLHLLHLVLEADLLPGKEAPTSTRPWVFDFVLSSCCHHLKLGQYLFLYQAARPPNML
jgi:hypothetical protein